jgi:hypothetical protein
MALLDRDFANSPFLARWLLAGINGQIDELARIDPYARASDERTLDCGMLAALVNMRDRLQEIWEKHHTT